VFGLGFLVHGCPDFKVQWSRPAGCRSPTRVARHWYRPRGALAYDATFEIRFEELGFRV